jgi:hypothetical protein
LLEWRVAQSAQNTAYEVRSRCSQNPTAGSALKRWAHQPVIEQWKKACDEAWIDVPNEYEDLWRGGRDSNPQLPA